MLNIQIFSIKHSNSKNFAFYVVIFLIECSRHFSCLSSAKNEAWPTLFCFKLSTHIWPVSIVSTTIQSREPHAVDTATSYFSSIAPKSP